MFWVSMMCTATTMACASTPPSAPPTAPLPPPPTGAVPAGAGYTRIIGSVAANPWTGLRHGGVVYIADASVKQPGVATSASIKIKSKEFNPFISVVTTGGTVDFANPDPLTHHIFSPDGETWDTGNLPQQGSVSRKFDTAGPYTLLCNLHPEMVGYLVVIPSTYFGMVATDGWYAIADVPTGTYQVTAWVPHAKSVTETVTVPLSGDVTANFELHPASE